jgi:hypothetical protein
MEGSLMSFTLRVGNNQTEYTDSLATPEKPPLIVRSTGALFLRLEFPPFILSLTHPSRRIIKCPRPLSPSRTSD